MKREDATGPYLSTSEGFVMALVVVLLSLLSFAIIIDRTPTTLASSGASVEGLMVAPEPGGFPFTIDRSSVYMGVGAVILVFSARFLGSLMQPNLGRGYVYHRIIGFIAVLVLFVSLLCVNLYIPGGFEIRGRALWMTPYTGMMILVILWFLLVLPLPVYTFPLLPEWVENVRLGDDTKREALSMYIDANWRRARLLTSLILTGAVGIVVTFVFSRTSPYSLLVVAIVGSVTIGPLGVIWFLMRRIREAEKELQPV